MKKIIIFIIVLCVTMCKKKPQSDHIIFVDMDRPEKASLFDYFRAIELIPLETTRDVLVARIQKIIIHEDRYYMLDIIQSIIFVFDQTGKFIFKIDKKGRGPGEYSFIRDFNINTFSGNLEILEPYGTVYVYDLTGNYIETKRVTYPDFRAVHMFAVVDSHTHVYYAMFQPKKIIYFNLDEKKFLHEELEENSEIGSFATKSLYSYQDDWYIFRPFHTVVYKFGKERLEPAFKFDFGTYNRQGTTATFSEETKRSWLKFEEEVFAQFPYAIRTVRHNNQYVMASILWKDSKRKANIIYDKAAGKSKFILDFVEKVEFDPDIITEEFVLRIWHWDELEEYITKEMLDDKQKEIFEGLMQSEMETNPILVKYWFK